MPLSSHCQCILLGNFWYKLPYRLVFLNQFRNIRLSELCVRSATFLFDKIKMAKNNQDSKAFMRLENKRNSNGKWMQNKKKKSFATSLLLIFECLGFDGNRRMSFHDKNEMNSLKSAYKGVCDYRDTLEKQSTQMLRNMFTLAKERKSVEDRRSLVTRQIEELHRLMNDAKHNRLYQSQDSSPWTQTMRFFYFTLIHALWLMQFILILLKITHSNVTFGWF